jgi:hypothetical protein
MPTDTKILAAVACSAAGDGGRRSPELLAAMLGFAHRLAALCDPRLALPMFLQSLAFQLSRFRAYAGARRKNMAYE